MTNDYGSNMDTSYFGEKTDLWEDSKGLKWVYELEKKNLNKEDGKEAALECLKSRAQVLIDNRDENGVSEQMIQNYSYYNLTPYEDLENPYASNQSSHNMIKACIDTEISTMGKNKPKINVLTDNAPYDIIQQGKKADQYLETQFEKSGIYEEVSDMILQANVKKTGVLKIWFDKETEGFKCKSINPINFYCYIPEEMGAKSDEREVMEVKLKDKTKLMMKYPKMKEKISQLDSDMDGAVKIYKLFYEGKWEACFTESCILYIKKNKRLPYFFWRRTNNSENNFWGIGIADQIFHLQIVINKLLYIIVSSAFTIGIPKFLVNRASDIVESHINNKMGAQINYSGAIKPEVVTPPMLHQQYFGLVDVFKDDCFLLTGIRKLSVGGEGSASLQRSSTNMKTYNAIAEERFLDGHKRLEKVYVDAGKYMLIEASEHYASTKSKNEFVKSIDWKTLDIKNNQYRVQTHPVNLLQESPAGKIQDIGTLAQLQVLKPDQVAELIVQYADVGSAVSLEIAPRLAAQKICSKIVTGENKSPETNRHLDIELLYNEAKKVYANALVKDTPEETLINLERYLDKLKLSFQAQTQIHQAQMSEEQNQQFEQQMQLEQAKIPPQGMPPGA